ncbi:hypothetical protein KSX_94130 [Ktedonospora formicarum]|uniref:Uncharacterized protein n=1 Tax=Ktedonospora formicarum TaxID=2778364 RepID=A0A8J3MXB2_9CHLR|nr:hypothetical protein KSX_94130 [Ktedonospora formicarum]
MLIDGSPQVLSLPTNGEVYLGVGLTEFEAPLMHCFKAHDDTALCQQFLNIAKTEREAEIEPYCVADNLRWEAIAFVVLGGQDCFHDSILTHCSGM